MAARIQECATLVLSLAVWGCRDHRISTTEDVTVMPGSAGSSGSTILEALADADMSLDEACDAMLACLSSYAKPELSPEDIARFAKDANFACSLPLGMLPAPCRAPPPLGVDQRNGKLVDMHRDYGYGYISLYYRGVLARDCCAIGGEPAFGGEWGAYLGCIPKVSDLSLYPRPPDGHLEPATTSACWPGKRRFNDGLLVPIPGVICENTGTPDALGRFPRCRRAAPVHRP